MLAVLPRTAALAKGKTTVKHKELWAVERGWWQAALSHHPGAFVQNGHSMEASPQGRPLVKIAQKLIPLNHNVESGALSRRMKAATL
jgi:hypothetical protein